MKYKYYLHLLTSEVENSAVFNGIKSFQNLKKKKNNSLFFWKRYFFSNRCPTS